MPSESSSKQPGITRITAGGLAVASFANTEVRAGVAPVIQNAFAAKGYKEEDFLRLSYPLVHEGVNLNGDEFIKAEMQAAYASLIGTPLDKDHAQGIDDIVGRHFEASYEERGGIGVILCDAYIYAGLYPDVAFKLVDGVINGVSMETQFAWSEKGPAKRTLHGLNFIGAGLVRMPADPNARVSIKAEVRQDKVEQLATAIARFMKEKTS